MIYYVIGLYVLITLWYSTHCKNCYFSKPPLLVDHTTRRSNNITNLIPVYQVQNRSVYRYSI